MGIWAYKTLSKFKDARLGNKIINFNDLIKERMIEDRGESLHGWVAEKEKRDYLILDEVLKDLPIKILKTQLYIEKTKVSHYVYDYEHIGFNAEKKYEFRELVNRFFDIQHSNQKHFLLLKLIAMTSYITKINARICSNIEFGKDSTFEVLNYLTNSIAVFDKPRTMAKLEYGVVNQVLVVNELIPKSVEEKHNINEFLLSIGSMKLVYQKTSRGSSAFGTKDAYNIENLSLIICYNTLNEVAEADKENYFDFVFGSNITSRYIPFKFSGKLNINQFLYEVPYTLDVDNELLKIARTIEWYKQNYKKEIKPFYVDINKLMLSERQKQSFLNIVNFINIYSVTEEEFKVLVNELLDCHYAYKRMLNSSSLITDFTNEQKPEFKNNEKEEELIVEVEEIIDTDLTPLKAIEQLDEGEGVHTEEISKKINLSIGDLYPKLVQLSNKGDIFQNRPDVWKVLN